MRGIAAALLLHCLLSSARLNTPQLVGNAGNAATSVRIIEFLLVISFMHFSHFESANATDSCDGPLAKKETAVQEQKERQREGV